MDNKQITNKKSKKKETLHSLSILAKKRYKRRVQATDTPSTRGKPFYVLDTFLRQEHNCQPYFLTITFPTSTLPMLEEWASMEQFLQDFVQTISKRYLCVAGIIAVEPHRNTEAHSRRGKNTKAGRPHIHAVLWFMHEFLKPDVQYIDFVYSTAGINMKIQRLKKPSDLVASALYTIKEKDQELLMQVCQRTLGWQTNIALLINHLEVEPLFLTLLRQTLNNAQLLRYYYVTTPSTPQFKDNQIFLAQLFSRLFAQQKLAVKDHYIYRPTQNTRYTWQIYMPLKQWITDQFDLNLPPAYLIKLKEALSWLYNAGAKRKNDVTFDIFPSLNPSLYLIEFRDCLYSFDQANVIQFSQVSSSTVSVCSEPYTFDETPLPYRMLYLLYLLISDGKDTSNAFSASRKILKRNDALEKPLLSLPKGQPRDIRRQYDQLQGYMQHFFKALETFGGLYHPKSERKKNKVLYLAGPSNSFKTFIIKTILSKLVGIENIDTISRHSSRFNTNSLRKSNDTPYVLFLDDFRWDSIGMVPADFLNLLDGSFVNTEQKFGESSTGPLKGTIAITSNHSIGQGPQGYLSSYSNQDLDALQSRMQQIDFNNLRAPQFNEIPKEFWCEIASESVAFSLLTNAYFLVKSNGIEEQAQLPKSFYQAIENKSLKPCNNLYEKTALFLLKEIMQEIQKAS